MKLNRKLTLLNYGSLGLVDAIKNDEEILFYIQSLIKNDVGYINIEAHNQDFKPYLIKKENK